MIDAGLEAWLQSLPFLGYDRQWIIANMPALEKRYRDNPGATMPACPEPSARAYDPYQGI